MVKTKAHKCKTCGQTLDAATPADPNSDGPQIGDLSICAYCARISKFDEELDLVPLTEGELEYIRISDITAYRTLQRIAYHIEKKIKLN